MFLKTLRIVSRFILRIIARIDLQNMDRIPIAITNEMMCRIAALLPPQYRGVYATHPRLQELLEVKPNLEKETRD